MNLIPCDRRVLIRKEKVEEVTKGGIILATESIEEKKREQKIAEVVGINDHPECRFKVGDKIYYAQYSGTEIKHDGEEYYLIHEKDILALIK